MKNLLLPQSVTDDGLAKAKSALRGTPAGSLIDALVPMVFRVVDKDTGAPIPGAPVVVWSSADARHGEGTPEQTVITDEKGEAHLRVFGAGESWSTQCKVRHASYVPAVTQWPKRNGDQVPNEYTLRLEKGTSIGGVVPE